MLLQAVRVINAFGSARTGTWWLCTPASSHTVLSNTEHNPQQTLGPFTEGWHQIYRPRDFFFFTSWNQLGERDQPLRNYGSSESACRHHGWREVVSPAHTPVVLLVQHTTPICFLIMWVIFMDDHDQLWEVCIRCRRTWGGHQPWWAVEAKNGT